MGVRELSDARVDGNRLGQSTTDLVSFYGKTPIVQPSSANQAAVSTTTSSAASTITVTTASTTTSPAGYATTTQANDIATLAAQCAAGYNIIRPLVYQLTTFCVQLRTDLMNLGLIKGAA